MPVYKGFDSWSKAERFVRLEFADNPVLDRAEKAVHTVGKVYPGRPKYETAHCILSLSGSLKAPTFVDLDARYYLDPTGAYDAEVEWDGPSYQRTTRCPEGWTVIDVEAFIGTEAAYQNGAPRFCLLEGEETMELYTTENGVETIIRQVRGERDDGYYYEALFALNGVRFSIDSAHGTDQQAALDGLKQVLDGFEPHS